MANIILQNLINENNKLSADVVSNGTTNQFVTSTEKETWNGKQDALVSGTSIKTINSTSLLGSGNIDIKTFQSFSKPSSVNTVKELGDWIVSSDGLNAKPGQAFLGGIALNSEEMPLGVGNAEVQVYCIASGILVMIMTSTTTPPYHWMLEYQGGRVIERGDDKWFKSAFIFDGETHDKLTWSSTKINTELNKKFEVPALPAGVTENLKYVLKAVIGADLTPTYTWELEA